MKPLKQRGATLIIVLCIVLLVAIIATIAVRQSSVSLKMATALQAQKLMMQNTDAALQKFESDGLAVNSIFYTVKKNNNKEIVWCYQNTNGQFFPTTAYGLISWVQGNATETIETSNAFCTASKFSTGRSAIVTQVATEVVQPTDTVVQDTSNAGELNSTTLRVYITSLMPVLAPSSVTPDQINACLLHMSSLPAYVTSGQTVSQCLSNLNVPNYTAVADYKNNI